MTLGFTRAGWDVQRAVESDPLHAATHRLNFPSCTVLEQDVQKVTAQGLLVGEQSPTLLFGGPPCQGFSVGGLRKEDDDRNDLVMDFARLVRSVRPDYFVLENVQGLLTRRCDVLDRFRERVHKAGFGIVEPIRVLDASDYGVPQRRKRVFVLGYRAGLTPPSYPEPLPTTPTVWDALGDLPASWDLSKINEDELDAQLGAPSAYARALRSSTGPRARLSACLRTSHSEAVVSRFRATGPGEREPVSRFVRLDKTGLAPTLRAGTTRKRGAFTAPRPIHPTADRCITVREAARLSSFPDSFIFHPTRWYGYIQVGNSVPPLLAEAVARSVFEAASTNPGEP